MNGNAYAHSAGPNFVGLAPQTLSADPSSTDLACVLRTHLALCEEVMALTTRENQALCRPADYDPSEFVRQRKELLPRLDNSLAALRSRRHAWQELSSAQRAGRTEIGPLFEAAQGLLMKVLLLDRENQQALLRRGLVPPRHLPAPAVQQPHCVADLYRRHASNAGS
jgi:hypothetical protein